mmetsp:Transcript_15814/g.43643  ORF Transcript_15814/g.43643 Transcript_15814/m.43643 type:complete len:82 (-) Transcript_15814:138-383(-)
MHIHKDESSSINSIHSAPGTFISAHTRTFLFLLLFCEDLRDGERHHRHHRHRTSHPHQCKHKQSTSAHTTPRTNRQAHMYM